MQPEEYARIAAAEDDHWWYRHTRAVMADMLAPWLRPGMRILDAGCGPGGNSAWLAPYGERVGADISGNALRLLKRRWPSTCPVQASTVDLPFGPATFDLVVTLTVLYMVDDDAGAVTEVRRVLRPGGVAFFLEPAFEALRRAHDDVVAARRRYRLGQLRALLEGAGLSVERASYAHAYLLPPAAALALYERMRPAAEARSDLQRGGALDRMFTSLTALERRLLARRNLPVGVSALVLATRP